MQSKITLETLEKILNKFHRAVVSITGICLLFMLANIVYLDWHGFGADHLGQVYIGKPGRIEVYNHNSLVSIIPIQPYRTYAFTTRDGESFQLSTASTIYTLDIYGNELESEDDKGCDTYEALRENKQVILPNGQKVIKEAPFLHTRIVNENGDILYQMPLLDYIIQLILVICLAPSFITLPVGLVLSFRKMLYGE